MGKSKSKYLHMRVASPRGTVTCRTHDIGRSGHTKRVACIKCTPKECKWKTQAFLIRKEDWVNEDPSVIKLYRQIKSRYPMAKLKNIGI
jgi:hypothetical protein